VSIYSDAPYSHAKALTGLLRVAGRWPTRIRSAHAQLSLLQTRAQGLSWHALSSDGHEALCSVLVLKGGASVEREETTGECGNAETSQSLDVRLPRRTAPLSFPWLQSKAEQLEIAISRPEKLLAARGKELRPLR
jgi:hypothetical protein